MSAPEPYTVREHYSDGSVAFFADAAPAYPEDIVRRVVRGHVKAVEVRYTDGSLVIVRRKQP